MSIGDGSHKLPAQDPGPQGDAQRGRRARDDRARRAARVTPMRTTVGALTLFVADIERAEA